jgi:Holliday junction DNA helicase RuvA
MIAKLAGHIDTLSDNSVILNVGGVGYHVFCSQHTLASLPSSGEAASLLIETVVREDFIHLYGFFTAAERDCFRLLITVQGVGMRVAQALLSTLAPNDLQRAIVQQDKTALSRAEGVGPKLAARLVNELKDKVASLTLPAGATSASLHISQSNVYNDALSALVNLGYRSQEAALALQRTMLDEAMEAASVQDLIRQSLTLLSKGTAA